MIRFTQFLQTSDVSPNTLKGYVYDIEKFCEWYRQSNGHARDSDVAIEQITPADLIEYKGYMLRRKTMAPASINRRLASLRACCRWSLRRRLIRIDPSADIKLMSIQRRSPKWLDKNAQFRLLREIQRDIQAPTNIEPRARNIRNQSMITLMLHAGLRASEVCDLDIQNVHISERAGWVDVIGKGQKSRRVPLNATSRRHLNDWLEARPILKPASPALYIARRGGITRQELYHVVGIYARRAGVACSPHTLRHTFAHNLIASGVQIEQVADLLGHSKLDTTRIYIQPSDAEMAESVERLCGG